MARVLLLIKAEFEPQLHDVPKMFQTAIIPRQLKMTHEYEIEKEKENFKNKQIYFVGTLNLSAPLLAFRLPGRSTLTNPTTLRRNKEAESSVLPLTGNYPPTFKY